MIENYFQQSKSIKNLKEKQRNGVPYVRWKITEVVKAQAENEGYYVIPDTYSISTRQFNEYRKLESSLLKELHHAFKRGKSDIGVRNLTQEDKNLLESYGIKVKVKKYLIILNPQKCRYLLAKIS